MLVYRIENELENTNVVHLNWNDALDDIYCACELEEKNKITLSIEEMTLNEFEALPEFEGY